MLWLWIGSSVVFAAALATYFAFEAVREVLLEAVADCLHWLIPCVLAIGCVVSIVEWIAVRDQHPGAVLADGYHPPPSAPARMTPVVYPEVLAGIDKVTPTEPERQAELRVVIIETGGANAETYPADFRKRVEAQLARHFRTAGIGLLAGDELRARLLLELQRNQEARALYDPATLQGIGDFYGATHGVFWTIGKVDDGWQVDCKLVRFKTAEVIASATALVKDGESLSAGVQTLGDALLSEIAEVAILTPTEYNVCGRRIVVQGRAKYVPRNWTLWLSLLPDTVSMHFPQRPVTVERNAEWTAPDVYLGEETIAHPLRFHIFAILVDAAYSETIKNYIASGSNVGLDIASWPREHCKIISHVTVTRTASADRIGCGVQ
jgi:hypothetical protein